MRNSARPLATLAAGVVLASILAAHPAAAQRVEVGNAATVVGDVRMSNAQIRNARKIERRQRLAWGDQVNTGKKSQLQILLLDRSTFGVGASSSVRIDRFVYDPNEGRSMFATFAKGALRFFSGRQEGQNSADIQTPAGRIGIRGTALDLLVGEEAKNIGEDEEFVDDVDNVDSDKDEATLVILRGPGVRTAGGLIVGRSEVEAAGRTVVLDQPGMAAYIPRNGAPPIGPFFISNRGLAKVQDQLAPEVARATGGGGGLLGKLIPAAVGAVALGVILGTTGGDNDGNDNRGGQTQSTRGQGTTSDSTSVPGRPNN